MALQYIVVSLALSLIYSCVGESKQRNVLLIIGKMIDYKVVSLHTH